MIVLTAYDCQVAAIREAAVPFLRCFICALAVSSHLLTASMMMVPGSCSPASCMTEMGKVSYSLGDGLSAFELVMWQFTMHERFFPVLFLCCYIQGE